MPGCVWGWAGEGVRSCLPSKILRGEVPKPKKPEAGGEVPTNRAVGPSTTSPTQKATSSWSLYSYPAYSMFRGLGFRPKALFKFKKVRVQAAVTSATRLPLVCLPPLGLVLLHV